MQKHSSLFKQSAIGVFWMGGSQVIGQIIHMMIRLILANLLAPADFGMMAMAMLLINFTNWFLDMGFGAALVQRKELTEAHKSTAFWANLLLGLGVFACLTLTAPLLALFFQTPDLGPLIICLGFGILFIAPRATVENLLMREGQFPTIAARQIWAIVCGGVTGLTLAWLGYGVWALVGESLVNSFSGTLFLFWQSTWQPKLVFERKAFLDLWHYSKPLIGARLFNYFNRNLDTILIGRFLGAAPLGFYNLGYQFVLMPLLYITRPLNSVLFTTFSKLQDDNARLRYGYLQAIELLAFVLFPVMALVTLATPALIPIVLGDKWLPATTLIPSLCLVGLIQSIQHLAPSVFQATGNTYLMARWTLTTVIINILAFSIGLLGGIQGVAIGYAGATLLVAPFLQSLVFNVLRLNWITFGKAIAKPAIITFIVIIAWSIADLAYTFMNLDSATLMKASMQVTIALGIYLSVSWHWNPAFKHTVQKLNLLTQLKEVASRFLITIQA